MKRILAYRSFLETFSFQCDDPDHFKFTFQQLVDDIQTYGQKDDFSQTIAMYAEEVMYRLRCRLDDHIPLYKIIDIKRVREFLQSFGMVAKAREILVTEQLRSGHLYEGDFADSYDDPILTNLSEHSECFAHFAEKIRIDIDNAPASLLDVALQGVIDFHVVVEHLPVLDFLQYQLSMLERGLHDRIRAEMFDPMRTLPELRWMMLLINSGLGVGLFYETRDISETKLMMTAFIRELESKKQ